MIEILLTLAILAILLPALKIVGGIFLDAFWVAFVALPVWLLAFAFELPKGRSRLLSRVEARFLSSPILGIRPSLRY